MYDCGGYEYVRLQKAVMHKLDYRLDYVFYPKARFMKNY